MERLLAWHGTNQSFERFDHDTLGLATQNDASRAAFFFAARPDTAWSYAHSAARKLVPDHSAHEARVSELLSQAEAAARRGQHSKSEQLFLALEEIETAAIQAPPSGARILHCALKIERPLMVDGRSHQAVTNLAEVLRSARAAGHDAVIFENISDTPTGACDPDNHIAVFSSDQIEILEICFEQDPEPEASFALALEF